MAGSADMGFWEKLMGIDRRWIYLAIGIVVFIPILMNLDLPVYITSEVKAVYDRVGGLPPGTVVMIPCEYDPATMAELRPMAHAVFRHCFAKDLKIVSCALQIEGVTLVKDDLAKIAAEYGKTYGEDYVFLGYKPYPAIVILNMGENFRKPFPKDYYGSELDELPMMKGVVNYSSCALIVIFGLMGGLKGAAEYEKLINHSAAATKAMSVQSIAHSAIVLFIIIGNVAYFASRKRKKAI